MRAAENENYQFFILIILLTAIKCVGLAIYGPIHAPDTPGYSGFADIILNETEWLHYEDLASGGQPRTSFRIIGYPLVIALAKLLCGSCWPWFIIGLQLCFSLLATTFVFRLTKLMSGRQGVGLFAALCSGVVQNVVLDQTIFNNSLNASLLLIMACHIGNSILSGRDLSVLEALDLDLLFYSPFLSAKLVFICKYFIGHLSSFGVSKHEEVLPGPSAWSRSSSCLYLREQTCTSHGMSTGPGSASLRHQPKSPCSIPLSN